MGTWGDGNLENDGAQDTLYDICQELFRRVIELLQHPRAHEYDDEEIGELFVRIEVIFALQDRRMITYTPKREELEPLFAPYLQRWANYIRVAGKAEPPEERKKVIEESFTRLLDIAISGAESNLGLRFGMILEAMEKRASERETDKD